MSVTAGCLASLPLEEGPWTAYQKWLVCLTAITIVFDGMDNQLLGITMPALIADWHVRAQRVRAGRVARLSPG